MRKLSYLCLAALSLLLCASSVSAKEYEIQQTEPLSWWA